MIKKCLNYLPELPGDKTKVRGNGLRKRSHMTQNGVDICHAFCNRKGMFGGE